jgi:hypothetical protein
LKLSANKRYLTDQRQGFNCAWIQLLCIDYTGGRKDGRTYDGLAPFTSAWDFTTPNPDNWSRVDAIVNLAATYGICCFLDVADTGGLIDTITANGPSKCFNYGVFLGNRYKSFPNIVWLSGNDYDHMKVSWSSIGDLPENLGCRNGGLRPAALLVNSTVVRLGTFRATGDRSG